MTHRVLDRLADDHLEVLAHGSPNAAGTHRIYTIRVGNGSGPPLVVLRFQEGDPKDGVNGVTVESLLAIVAASGKTQAYTTVEVGRLGNRISPAANFDRAKSLAVVAGELLGRVASQPRLEQVVVGSTAVALFLPLVADHQC